MGYNPSIYKADLSWPVENVSKEEILYFLQRLNQLFGYENAYRQYKNRYLNTQELADEDKNGFFIIFSHQTIHRHHYQMLVAHPYGHHH